MSVSGEEDLRQHPHDPNRPLADVLEQETPTEDEIDETEFVGSPPCPSCAR